MLSSAPRRRRKRRRTQTGGNSNKAKTKTLLSSFYNDDSLAFLDAQGDALSDRRPLQSCLPALIEERRSGGLKNNRRVIASFQSRALSNFTKKPENEKHCHRQWRSFARRCINFTKLGTPTTDAVLSLERKGSYTFCLGSKYDAESDDGPGSVPLSLALRFYGVPSPCAVLKRERDSLRSRGSTPLLATIPLLYDTIDECAEESIFNFARNVSPASTPVNILISSDWNVGMAMFQPSNVWREEGQVGTLVLFSLPGNHRQSGITRVFQCINVRLGAGSSFTLRNLLWRVEGIPQRPPEGDTAVLFDSVLTLPGYLVFNDEEDGFRITWVVDQWNFQEAHCKRELGSSPLATGRNSTAAILSIQDTWEAFHSDFQSGQRVYLDNPTKDDASGAMIASEIFLHVDALLLQVLERRKNFSSLKNPEFFYNLVSVTEKGRVVELIITFLRKKGKPISLGVFVKVDLFTGIFQELEWVKSTTVTDRAALRHWSNKLALNKRMRHVRAGPFAIHNKGHTKDWGRLCKESLFDPDETDDYDPSVWLEYSSSAESMRPPKFISLSSLYSDCDLVNNKAITSCLPVSSLKCKDSPVQLVYG